MSINSALSLFFGLNFTTILQRDYNYVMKNVVLHIISEYYSIMPRDNLRLQNSPHRAPWISISQTPSGFFDGFRKKEPSIAHLDFALFLVDEDSNPPFFLLQIIQSGARLMERAKPAATELFPRRPKEFYPVVLLAKGNAKSKYF